MVKINELLGKRGVPLERNIIFSTGYGAVCNGSDFQYISEDIPQKGDNMDDQKQRRINIAEISQLMDPEFKSKYVWLLTVVAQKDDAVYKLMLEWRDSTKVGRQFADTYIAQEMQILVLDGAEQRKRNNI